MKNIKLIQVLILTFASYQAGADSLPDLYPFKPYSSEVIREHLVRITEDESPIENIFEIEKRQLSKASPAQQPWAGSYWPLIQGQIGNSYRRKTILRPNELLSWKENVSDFKKHRETRLSRVYELTEKELAYLAPSEKYDLLLGDTSFDLTNRIWSYVENYGASKMWGYLNSNIDIPNGYRLPNPNDSISLWEGICHGWALAAGGIERPLNTIEFELPNGKKLPIYPTDIKALISLMYANSDVQGEVLMEGRRCNKKKPLQDKFGRYYDDMKSKNNETVEPPCADVHPAIWHLSVVNLTGVQKRAFVVEIDANSVVNNHPFAGYEYKYFNPKTGRVSNLERALLSVSDYQDDPFKSARSSSTVSIVGVEMTMRYTNWTNPREGRTDSAKKDPIKKKVMRYDLELDQNGNVVGGQWRVTADVNDYLEDPKGKTNQPDFFWTLPKNYKSFFSSNKNVSAWQGLGLPPNDWKTEAIKGHGNVYRYGSRCTLIEEVGEDTVQVPCSFSQPRPMPFINLVLELLNRSRN